MEASTVLITGATGHLGFRVLVLTLKAGYNARVAVRTLSGYEKILATPSILALKTGTNLTAIIVPDILADGAYNEAVKGVQYIIHCASPITSGITSNFEELIIAPAVTGTTGILESARSSPSVKRIVITSSAVAIIPVKAFSEASDEIYNGQLKIPLQSKPYQSEMHAYVDGKVRALAAAHAFVAEKKPRFDIINLMPSYIIGKNELLGLSEFMTGTNRVVFGQVLGLQNPNAMIGATVYLNDIAKLHVVALNPSIAGNQDFPASSGGVDGVRLSEALDIVARRFPEEVAEGILPNSGSQPTLRIRIDVSETERAFAMKFEGLETQVEEVARHYLEVVEKSKRS